LSLFRLERSPEVDGGMPLPTKLVLLRAYQAIAQQDSEKLAKV
jgi:hypothetical protein